MASERDIAESSEDTLAAKIQLLEAELASLKASLRLKQAAIAADSVLASPGPAAAPGSNQAPLPVPQKKSAAGLLDSAWAIEKLQYLVRDRQPHSIHKLLDELGQRFKLRGLELWRWDASANRCQLLQQWAAQTVTEAQRSALQDGAWLESLIMRDQLGLERLQKNQSLTLLATDPENADLSQKLGALGIFNTLIVPCCENKHLGGLMTLQRDTPRSWDGCDIQMLGQVLSWLLSLIDQQQQLRLLVDRETRYEYAMEATNDGLWDWNLSTNKIFFSRSYLHMLGYDYDELPGNLQTLQDYFLHPEDVAGFLVEYHAAQENRQANLHLQYRMLHRDGRVLWVSSKAKFFEPDAQGVMTRVVGINTDISSFVHSREELVSAKAQADMANKTKSDFLARVSHEIRTPMNAIIGMGYLMQDTALDEQQQSYLTSINSAADSLLQIINQLLDFSKIEAGRVILEYAHFDLEQLFEKVSRLFEISALHKAANIVCDIKPDVPRFLRGDASRLSQILGHLISNALQYSNTNAVLISVRKLTQNHKKVVLEFSVADNGMGMTQEKLAHIRAKLLGGKLGVEGENNTYGLGICNHLVHLMEGDFALDSALNKGCKVTFSAQFERSHLGEKTLLSQPRDLNNIRALIVDDNTIARTIIASTARSIHLHVDEVDSPLAALEKIRQADNQGNPYHFILLDYRMPNMNGLQLTGLIKSDCTLNTKPQIFLISAYHRDEISSTEPNAILIDEFLSKPVSESRLFDAISQAIGREPFLQELSPAMQPEHNQQALLENLRVLIAEDNVVNQQVIRGILKKKNISTVIASNGAEAVHCIETASEPFDIVLMDLEMPEMDGLEATYQIRLHSQQQDVPIVAVTAQAMRGDRERCLAAGMNGYLSKPVNPELLYSTLADILRLKKVANGNTP